MGIRQTSQCFLGAQLHRRMILHTARSQKHKLYALPAHDVRNIHPVSPFARPYRPDINTDLLERSALILICPYEPGSVSNDNVHSLLAAHPDPS